MNLKTFLLQRAAQNESVALCLYWFVKVEIKDSNVVKSSTLTHSASAYNIKEAQNDLNSRASSNTANDDLYYINQTQHHHDAKYNDKNLYNLNKAKTNFQIFMEELVDVLRNGDEYARSIYESILNQERFLKSLNEVVRAVQRESGLRDTKVIKLRNFLNETSKTVSTSSNSWSNLVDFERSLPLILDPIVKINGINVESSTMFKSNLMPCKFVFKTDCSLGEYSAIYKIGDDLRQDQLVLQMIALMDKVIFRSFYKTKLFNFNLRIFNF